MTRFTGMLIFTLAITWLMSSTLYSQTTQLIKGDTSICFTITQSKFLLKQAYKVKELTEIISINNQERIIYDSITKNNNEIIQNQDELLKDSKEILKLKEFQIQEEKDKTKQAQKETRKQRTGKIAAIVIGTAVAILEGVLFITAK